jgi:hypothetical protein
MVAVIVAFILAGLLSLRFETWTYSLNRRTGMLRGEHRYFHFWTVSHPDSGMPDEFDRFGVLTAADREVLVGESVRRYPWSGEPESTEGEGALLLELYVQLFVKVGLRSPLTRPLEADRFKALMIERLKIWNSRLPDDDASALLARIMAENDKLFAGNIP